jgi:hypothetical protein
VEEMPEINLGASKLLGAHVGAHPDRAALKPTCSRLTLLSPLLTFRLTLQLTLASTVPFMRPTVLLRVLLPNQDPKLATLGGVAAVSLPSESPLDLFPPTEYKMESNPGPGLLAAKFSLVQRPLQPLSLLPPSPPFHNLRGLDSSFYDGHGQAKCYDGRTMGSS